MNPYLILGVPLQSDDAQIRRAYLEAVKRTPPDTHPERFQAANQAYEAIKDESSRLKYYLFDKTCPADSPLDAFVRHVRSGPSLKPLPFEEMKEFLRACSKT
jgi:curved DNA-binding protein CbpA